VNARLLCGYFVMETTRDFPVLEFHVLFAFCGVARYAAGADGQRHRQRPWEDLIGATGDALHAALHAALPARLHIDTTTVPLAKVSTISGALTPPIET
jgi:hypothetical protein